MGDGEKFLFLEDEAETTYHYKTKVTIPNIVELPNVPMSQAFTILDNWIKQLDPTYQPYDWASKEEPSGDDYRPAAYLCQVLGLNGIKWGEWLILCNNGERWLHLQGRSSKGNVPECKDLTGITLPQGATKETAIQRPKPGIHYYTAQEAEDHRAQIKNNPLPTQLQRDYLGIEEANKELS